jgi:hypothetical protein
VGCEHLAPPSELTGDEVREWLTERGYRPGDRLCTEGSRIAHWMTIGTAGLVAFGAAATAARDLAAGAVGPGLLSAIVGVLLGICVGWWRPFGKVLADSPGGRLVDEGIELVRSGQREVIGWDALTAAQWKPFAAFFVTLRIEYQGREATLVMPRRRPPLPL